MSTQDSAAGVEPVADAAVAANTDSTTAAAPVAGEGQGEADNKPVESAEGSKPEEQEAGGPPEQYEAFTLPDGYTLEGERLEAVHEFARQNGWSQERAQAGVTEYLKLREAERETERGLWGAQAEEEFGAGFKDLVAGVQRARTALEAQRPGFTERLDATNLGNHPDVLWLVNELGKHLKPAPLIGMENEAAGTVKRDLASRFYPNM